MIAHEFEKVLNFMRNSKLAHILVLIEALIRIELRKMLIRKRKKVFDVRFGNCSTPKVPRFCRFTGFTK